jgi:hypothetical protein
MYCTSRGVSSWVIPSKTSKPRPMRPTTSLSTATLAVVAGVALALNLAATAWLNASYAASGFPVPYHVAQLSFDAQQIKGWYAFLIENGTLGAYWQTQFIDFVFIGI